LLEEAEPPPFYILRICPFDFLRKALFFEGIGIELFFYWLWRTLSQLNFAAEKTCKYNNGWL
jgi:hypothetical protein